MPVAKTTFMRDIVYLERISCANMPHPKPKLLLLVTSSAWGGAERYVVRLASQASAEFDVTVAAGTSVSRELFRRLPAHVASFELKDLVRQISPLKDARAALRLREFIDREKFDLVHVNSSKAGLVGTLAARFSRSKPPVIYTAHGWGFSEKRSWFFRLAVLWSEKIAAPHRAATIVLTSSERDIALDNRLSTEANTHLIPLGIDEDEIDFLDRAEARAEISRACGFDDRGGRIIGTIANAYPAKDLSNLLKSFDSLAAKMPSIGLVVFGDGPEMPKLSALRAALPNGKRVYLPGAMPDAARLLKGFDVFALSSSKEGMPWVMLEASLAGIPIVATRVGAIPELIEDRVSGLLVESGDASALAEALGEVLTDPELYAKLKSGVARLAERRSGREMISRTLGLYRSIIRRS